MKLFIINKSQGEKEVFGEERFKRAHQDAYKQLQESLLKEVVPLCLAGEFIPENYALFHLSKYDRIAEIFYYEYECVMGG